MFSRLMEQIQRAEGARTEQAASPLCEALPQLVVCELWLSVISLGTTRLCDSSLSSTSQSLKQTPSCPCHDKNDEEKGLKSTSTLQNRRACVIIYDTNRLAVHTHRPDDSTITSTSRYKHETVIYCCYTVTVNP